MSKGKTTNPNPSPDTRFKPGVSGNPGGKMKGMLTAASVSGLISKLAVLTLEELRLVRDDAQEQTHKRIIAAELVAALEKNDYGRLEALLMRGVGKVKDVVEQHTHNHDKDFENAPRESVIELLRKASNG